MTAASNTRGTIVRTERGLSLAGTRITLDDAIDYVTAKYAPKFIQEHP